MTTDPGADSEMKEPTLTSKHLLTSALHQLASIQPNPGSPSPSNTLATSAARTRRDNILTNLAPPSTSRVKSALLTLHFLFPFDFLPALDLIDRHLIQNLRYQHPDHPDLVLQTFYVQSASAVATAASSRATRARGGRFGNRNYAATKVHYEVRLDAWNCSCPAFAAANMKLILGSEGDSAGHSSKLATTSINAEGIEAIRDSDGERSDSILLGGLATKDDAMVPVCKHILAAALCDVAPSLFGGGMTTREVSDNELAAWAAGWGET